MKFSAITALFATIAPVFAVDFSTLPDGAYSGKINADGSYTLKRADVPRAASVTYAVNATALAARNADPEKRFTSCWGSNLDRTGTDLATNDLRKWANVNGGRTIVSHERPDYFGFNRNGVYVYYCINAPNSQGNIDLNDVNFALSQMDSHCPRYTAGYWQWDGSVELIGKAASGTNVCRG